MKMDKLYMIKEGELEEIQKPVFSKGDSYIAVDKEAQKVYIWLGSKCSVDEKGTAAAQARTIDDGPMFNGAAKIITYDEGDESPEFLAKLEGLRIVNKNLAKSMFKDVKTGEFSGQEDHVNALYKVSSEEFEGGIEAIKYVQVPFSKDELDPDDVMVADLGTEIWVWQGKEANVREKVKGMQIAREFDADRAGAQSPKVFMQGEDDEEFLGIFDGTTKIGQDRDTFDLKAERFDEDEGEPEPEQEPEPKAETVPAPEPKIAEKAVPKENSDPVPQAPGETVLEGRKSGMLVQKGEGRLKCPKCGNVASHMIKERVDRTHIIMDYPRMYGKKHQCGKCGAEWRRET